MALKKKTTKKAADLVKESGEILEIAKNNLPEIPEGMEGKARYKGVPCDDYAQKLLTSQSITNSATEKAIRIEKGLMSQGYDVDDIKKSVTKIMKELL